MKRPKMQATMQWLWDHKINHNLNVTPAQDDESEEELEAKPKAPERKQSDRTDRPSERNERNERQNERNERQNECLGMEDWEPKKVCGTCFAMFWRIVLSMF